MKDRYLKLTELKDALSILKSRCLNNSISRTVPVSQSAGRVTASAIYSKLSIPSWHLSAMDGIAVASKDTIGATEQNPKLIKHGIRINTGNIIPDGFDAVIMIEDVVEAVDGYIIRSSVSSWSNIRPVGEDITSTEMILPGGRMIRPQDIGALLSYGITSVDVISVHVALIPTGSEIVPPGTRPSPGQVIESNMGMIAAALKDMGADVFESPIIPDDPGLIRSAIEDAVNYHDLILVSAGSSKGTRDHTADCIRDLGEIYIHGISIKPAKPVIIGEINSKLVIGIPGYPVACYTILREIISPVLSWYGLSVPEPRTIRASLSGTLTSEIGTDEFVLMSIGKMRGRWVAHPLSRGSGVQMSMVRANAYCKIPYHCEGYESGTDIDVTLTVPISEAEKTILIIGSHDPVIDRLSDLLRKEGIIPSSTNVGSMGGLLALKRGDCHLAPMHLLGEDGDYNISYLKKYIPGEDLVLICVAEREQGIVSNTGLTFDDITSHEFVNRQKGSGTRMLLDFILREKGINPHKISGYDREATTHLGVCLAVKNGDADLGLAVHTAARAFELLFVPIGTERYELVTTARLAEEDYRIQSLISRIQSEQFKEILNALGGYQTKETGVIRKILN